MTQTVTLPHQLPPEKADPVLPKAPSPEALAKTQQPERLAQLSLWPWPQPALEKSGPGLSEPAVVHQGGKVLGHPWGSLRARALTFGMAGARLWFSLIYSYCG